MKGDRGKARRLVLEFPANIRRRYEMEQVYTCQRYAEGTRVTHKDYIGTVVAFEFQGAWASLSGLDDEGSRIERYLRWPQYIVQFETFKAIMDEYEIRALRP